MAESGGRRGVSKVVGVVLLLAIVLLLSVVTAVMVTGVGAPERATFGSVDVDTDQRTTFIEMQGVNPNTDELEIVVNGNVERTWRNFSAGSRLPLFCLRPGDDVVVRQRNDDGSTHIVAEHTMNKRSGCRFDVSNDGNETTVSPINWQSGGDSVKEFYNYRDPHAHMDPDFVKQNTSYVFFYEIDKEVALVFVHDRPQAHTTGHDGDDHDGLGIDGTKYGDTAGGAVDMRIDGEPKQADWVIQDDDNDYTCDDPNTDVCWSWAEKHTDGGALSGGFKGDLTGLEIVLNATWDSNAEDWGEFSPQGPMEKWQFVYRDTDGNLQTMNLTKTENTTIEIADDT